MFSKIKILWLGPLRPDVSNALAFAEVATTSRWGEAADIIWDAGHDHAEWVGFDERDPGYAGH